MILTRYLYIKSKVEISLKDAIKKHYYKEAVFWAYELYFSGFKQEVLDILENIYQTMFSKNHPKLGRYIKMKRVIETPELIATIIKNLTMKNPEIKETSGVKFVNVKRHHIEPFMTKEPEGPGWKFLREVCLYGVLGKCSKDELTMFRSKWIYCLSQTPLWRERMKEYGEWKEDVFVFTNEYKEEEFHDKWDYEPDEQPLIIQERCIGKGGIE